MKKNCLMLFLLTLEAIAFYSFSMLLGYDLSLIHRYAFALFVFLLIFHHYNITSNLIWNEMKSILEAVISFLATSYIIIEPTSIFTQFLWKNLTLAIFMFVVCIVLDRSLRIVFRPTVAKRTLIIGTGPDANRLGEIACRNRFALTNVVGYVKYGDKVIDHSIVDRMNQWEKQGNKFTFSIFEYKDLDEILTNKRIEQVIVALPNSSKEAINQIMLRLYDKVEEIKYLPNLDVMITFDSKIQDFDGMLLISTAKGKLSVLNRMLKRAIDIISSLVGILLLVPLTLFVKYQNKKNGDTDPLFFTQERIGLHGKPIKIYKFRTMVPNAEKILDELMEKDPAIREEYLTNKKLVNDPRITKVGEFLRKSSIDEFPQFLSVLKGEMSLVGPRPYLFREKDDMGIYYDSVISCKPGITGMWQANGRSDIGFLERCKLDDYYYRNWTLWLDIIIIYKTMKSVIYGKGAL